MKINPYLSFDGQCQAALKFYERCLGGKIVYMMTYAQSPIAAQVPPEWAKRIYHATFSLGDQTLGAADAPPRRRRSPFRNAFRRGHGAVAGSRDSLGTPVRGAHGPIRYAMDDQLRHASMRWYDAPPNKRFKLRGGDRSKGTGVFAPWQARTGVPHPCAGGRVARSLSAIR